MIDLGKKNVVGVLVNVIDYECAVEQVISAAQSKRTLTVSALAVHGIMTGVLDRTHCHRLNCFNLIVPDGQPVRWALNWLYKARLHDRVYGPEFTLRICERAAREKLSVFLYGSRREVLDKLVSSLHKRFPTLNICGTSESLFRRVNEQEQEALIATIRAADPSIIFVGLGCPRQEVWVYENASALNCPVIAVGAAFDFHAGLLPQAPRWMQEHGLEWLYRLSIEPRRLWRRYFYLNPAYLSLLALQKLGFRRFPCDNTSPPIDRMWYA